MRRFWFGYMPLCFVLSFLLNQAPATPPVWDLPQSVLKRGGAGLCCPLYLWSDHGSYTTWYAEKCKGQYCSLDTTAGGPGTCNAPNSSCISVPAFAGATTTALAPGTMFYHSNLRTGIAIAAPVMDHIPAASKVFATKARDSMLVLVETTPNQLPADNAKVLLHLTIITPAGGPPMLFATGLEVSATGMPVKATIPNSQVGPVDGKICQVQFGGITHQVVLGKHRPDGDPKAGRAEGAPASAEKKGK